MSRPRTTTPTGMPRPPLADNLARLRKQHGLTQAALAEKIEASLAHIARIETGQYQPSVTIIPKLMQALDVSADALLVPTQAPPSEEQHLADLFRSIRGLDSGQRDMVAMHVSIYRDKRRMKVVFLPIPTNDAD